MTNQSTRVVLTPRLLASEKKFGVVRLTPNGRTAVWVERRTGRGVLLVKRDALPPRDIVPDHDVGAEIGYGGGELALWQGCVFYVNKVDGALYRVSLDGDGAERVSPRLEGKLASPAVSPDGRWVLCVHESEAGTHSLLALDARGASRVTILTSGRRVMQPRWSPDGDCCCWVSWPERRMPWDGATLEVARFDNIGDDPQPSLLETRVVTGGPGVAIFQPEFLPNSKELVFVSDETGWGRIAHLSLDTGAKRWFSDPGIEYSLPAWQQDSRSFAVSPCGGYLVAAGVAQGFSRLYKIDLVSGACEAMDTEEGLYDFSSMSMASEVERLILVCSGPSRPPRVLVRDMRDGSSHCLATAFDTVAVVPSVPVCCSIDWPTTGGKAHGLLYDPSAGMPNSSRRSLPLFVLIHGGPTSQSKAAWKTEAAFFAERGYLVLLINYRGSWGYGRAYMQSLQNNWGVVDVDDVTCGVKWLVEKGMADGRRVVLFGTSAGGLTALRAVATSPGSFAGCVSVYGITDLLAFAEQTHAFEQGYAESLVGSLPDSLVQYRERSPLWNAQQLRRPVMLYHGGADRVVPARQSAELHLALIQLGLQHSFHLYPQEGHGFKYPVTLEHYYSTLAEFADKAIGIG